MIPDIKAFDTVYDKEGNKYKIIPVNPPKGLLMSMAIRSDHAIAWPGYYDKYPRWEGCTHARMVEATLTEMNQLYEEVAGTGFYSFDKETEYDSLATNNTKETSNETETESSCQGFTISEVSDEGC